jgi:hypothetical protein
MAVTGRIRDTGKNVSSLLFKQDMVVAPDTSTFSSLSHFSRRPLLEIKYNYYTTALITKCINKINNAIINNKCGRPQDLILLFTIPMGVGKNFFKNDIKF